MTFAEQVFVVAPEHVTVPIDPNPNVPWVGFETIANVSELPSASLPVNVIVVGAPWAAATDCASAVGARSACTKPDRTGRGTPTDRTRCVPTGGTIRGVQGEVAS